MRIVGGFWAVRQRVNGAATLGHALEWMDELGWTGNFTSVANGAGSRERRGREFSDSEVYKIVEAMSWEHGRTSARGALFGNATSALMAGNDAITESLRQE